MVGRPYPCALLPLPPRKLVAEWQYCYYRGLLAARLRGPGWRAACLDALAEAAVLAGCDASYGGGGLLLPLVALHGRRARWLAKAAAGRVRRAEAGGGEGEGMEAESQLRKRHEKLLQLCAR